MLSQLVLPDIRSYAKRALENEQALRDELMREQASLTAQQQKTEKATLKAAEKRLFELDRLTQSLYEDKVLGSIPEATFKNLMGKYEVERVEKSAVVEENGQTSREIRIHYNLIDKIQ